MTVLLIIFQHFSIVKPAGYEITILLVLLPVWLLNCFQLSRTFKLNSIIWYLFFLVYPLINFLTIYSVVEFLKTYLQFVLCISVFFLVYNARYKIERSTLLKAIKISQTILILFLLLQYLVVIQLKMDGLYNPWGMFSWKYPLPRDEYNFFRMKGFYLEPSYVAFISFTLFICRFFLENKISIINIVISICCLLLINSSFGFLAFGLMVPFINFNRFKGVSKLFIVAVSLLPFILLPDLLSVLLNVTKLNNLSYESYSSAYTRWVFPINLTSYIFSKGYYLGYAMGQLDPIISDFDLIIIQSEESGVSNSLASLTIYFGIATIIILFFLLLKFLKGNDHVKIYILYILICLSNTGAFNSIEFFFSAIILPFIALKLTKNEIEHNNSLLQ